MDAMLLATLVGLICNFRQERGAREALTHRQFAEWLAAHRFQGLSDQIANTFHLQSEVDALLREDHQAIMAKLGEIERMMAALLSRVPGFGELARAVHPEWELSEQALEILRTFVESGSPWMQVTGDETGNPLYCVMVPARCSLSNQTGVSSTTTWRRSPASACSSPCRRAAILNTGLPVPASASSANWPGRASRLSGVRHGRERSRPKYCKLFARSANSAPRAGAAMPESARKSSRATHLFK